MSEKNYLAKIIAKDLNGIQVISACCSEAKVKIEDIKRLSGGVGGGRVSQQYRSRGEGSG